MLLSGYVASEDLWDTIEDNSDFRDFVGKCVTHFNEFVYPFRDHKKTIRQDYPVPKSIDIIEDTIWITKAPDRDRVFIDFEGIEIPDEL